MTVADATPARTRAEGASPLMCIRLREARTAQSLTLRKLASRIGVSASLISQIENGKVLPSVNTLYALASELGLSIDDLLVDGGAARRRDAGGAACPVARAGERTTITLNDRVSWERLTARAEPGVDFFHVVYLPGGESTPRHVEHRHAGQEFGYLISGLLVIEIGDERHELGAGDSVTFDSSRPHRLHNPGVEAMHAIWFVLGRRGDARFAGGGRAASPPT